MVSLNGFYTTGRYPNKLTLVDLAQQKFDIAFSPEECQRLYEDAKALLNRVNQSIEKGIFDAVVSEENCKYCLYRPSCSYYKTQIQDNVPFNDLVGVLENAIRYQNGNTSLFIKNNSGLYTVTGLVNNDFKELQNQKGKQIGVYNLKKESKEHVYTSRKTTIVYEH